eukprot:TRINITY_DN12465_c0_g1_i3.p3 TRINITY_DN12465_c0_g1~~TRINITY_DN12465_c0_g1_i3.p3  ORF type:complete len:211 (+),score=63.38 TRINITY_DN12465_c0_g1_i3:77-709(+)
MRRRRPSAAAAGGADGAAPPAKRQRVVDGVAEGDALQRRLEDITRPGLDLLIVGYNPGVASAARGHHFAGDGNHMWPCLRHAGLVPQTFDWRNDRECLKHGVGFSSIVQRPTRSSADIQPAEYAAGAAGLLGKLRALRPKVVCFVGVGVWQRIAAHVWAGRSKTQKCPLGLQREELPGCGSCKVFVTCSTSGRVVGVQLEDSASGPSSAA